ncbi:26s protease regulatory subunit 7 [Phtheirospermum japonicum]|uniref:26s protease regulatory subunit 7 n=1 Tax=Phtheirospermum japonicum TaxID=374723 RepID=A0A830C320_9LAMI|nr:26s protease regulatory subunit 7 [Phtheirospermum japonicum]
MDFLKIYSYVLIGFPDCFVDGLISRHMAIVIFDILPFAIQKLLRRILEDTKDASESFRLLVTEGVFSLEGLQIVASDEYREMLNVGFGIKESDTGLAAPSQWDLVSDKQMMQEEPLQFLVGLGVKVSPTEIEEGMRVGVDRNKYQTQIPLPPKINPNVTMMTMGEKPDVTYNDVGGCKEQIEKMREVVELPMRHPEKFLKLGIDPPKVVLCYGPPGTGKTLLARAVANQTDAYFIRVIGSELVQKYVGEGACMVRELFQARLLELNSTLLGSQPFSEDTQLARTLCGGH